MAERLLYGVGGNPVLHSKSPELFKILAGENRNFDYVRVKAESAEELIRLFEKLGFSGMNITAPFKSDIISYLDNIDDDAKKAGAVNLIKKIGEKIKGYNTDVKGVLDSFKFNGIEVEGKKTLVVGAGGAARAAIFGLKNEGAMVSVVNRSRERGKLTASDLGVDLIEKEKLELFLRDADIIVSTLDRDRDLINPEWIRKGAILLRADYKKRNLEPASLHYSELDGFDWLFFQGVPSFEILTGSETEDLYLNYKNIKEKIAAGGKKPAKIYLTGFMGSGKSSTGRIMAEKGGYLFYDIDAEIEKSEGISIKKIFEEKGEKYFRKIEKVVLEKISRENNIICSTGGGIVKDPENRNILKKDSVVVWIYSDLKNILHRVDPFPRPLMNGKNQADMENLFKDRKNYYAEVADIIVPNNNNIENCSRSIYEEISKLM
ncbi:MAG: shikimate kinase [Acidobacteriota bacterium]